MQLSEALNNVEELLVGENSIPVKLRMHEGLDQKKFEELIESLEMLVTYYQGHDTVPKRLALAFIDVGTQFYFNEGEYSEQELEKIEDAGITLSEIANRMFS